MDSLVRRAESITLSAFKSSVRDYILKGIKKGRHYFYLRDAIGFNDYEFEKLMEILSIEKNLVFATKQNYYNIFTEPKSNKEQEE